LAVGGGQRKILPEDANGGRKCEH